MFLELFEYDFLLLPGQSWCPAEGRAVAVAAAAAAGAEDVAGVGHGEEVVAGVAVSVGGGEQHVGPGGGRRATVLVKPKSFDMKFNT